MIDSNNRFFGILFPAFIALMLTPLCAGCVTGFVYRQNLRSADTAYREEYNVEELNEYGEWVYVEGYGNVWRPLVSPDWKPFLYGHWTYADEGWTWISYEPFGWIVYHYGDWMYTPAYGWVWIPGYGTWSPARVQWFQYDDYVCWAPLAPGAVVWPLPWEQRKHNAWIVVRRDNFTSEDITAHRVDRALLQSQPYRGEGMTRGPDLQVIRQHSRVPVQTEKIEREKVRIGKREFGRMRMPESEQRRAEKFRPKVEKEVIRRSGERRQTR
jgi:hypothetical protein